MGNVDLVKRSGLTGTQVAADYELLEVLGEGGHASVFKARHVRLERLVAIKVLMDARLGDTAAKRFEREAQVLSRINHYNVVSVYDYGLTLRGCPYFVMEYLEGESLFAKIVREGPLSLAVAVTILLQACSGLQEAHKYGIIHRDLKPENIFLQGRSDRADWVKIVDFGIAHLAESGQGRITMAGRVEGTPCFLAPERFAGQPGDERSDIYSLGLVLFEMLTARSLFTAETTMAVMEEMMANTQQPLSSFREDIAPGSGLDTLFARATDLDIERRYQTVTELRDELARLQGQLARGTRAVPGPQG